MFPLVLGWINIRAQSSKGKSNFLFMVKNSISSISSSNMLRDEHWIFWNEIVCAVLHDFLLLYDSTSFVSFILS